MKRKLIPFALIILLAIFAAACSKAKQTEAGGDNYPNAHLLVDVKWIEEHAKDPKVVIIDARPKGYEQGHIPGAISLPYGELKDGNSFAPKEKFTKLMQDAGVNKDSTIVVYDEGGALGATRVFYVAEYYGLKDKVKVLNGGFLAWTVAGKDVSTDVPKPAKGSFVAEPNPNLITTKEQLMKMDIEQCTLLDTRTEGEYNGTDLRGNKKGGHLEGAVHKEWNTVFQQTADGVPLFLNYKELKKSYEEIGLKDLKKTVVPYCQTNIRGAHSYFTLRLLGFTDIRPYEGSWAEWGNADDTKVVK
jgi:thiosulfate/3-mercaptopyruvate sulfurtransferase